MCEAAWVKRENGNSSVKEIFRPDSLDNFPSIINSHYPFCPPLTHAYFPFKKEKNDKNRREIHSKLFRRGFEMCAFLQKKMKN